MKKLRQRFSSLVFVLIASMVINPMPVMAKANKNPASITKQKLVYEGTSIQVKNPVLVQGADRQNHSIRIEADALLSNSVSTDYLDVTAVSSDNVKVTKELGERGKNIFVLEPKDAKSESSKGDSIEFVFTVKSTLKDATSSNKNADGIKPYNSKTDKKVKLKVKVIKDSASVNLGGTLQPSDVTFGNGVGIIKRADETLKVDGLNQEFPIEAYDIDTTGAKSKKNGKDLYTIPFTVSVNSNGNLAVVTTNSKVATASYAKKTGLLTVKVNRNAYTGADGIAEVMIGVGVKGTETQVGTTKYYGSSKYIKLYVKPDAKTKKVTSASPAVNGTKATKAALVIGAGETTVSANIGAIYSSNGGEVKVEWTEADKDNYSLKNVEGKNYAVLIVKKPITGKKGDQVELKGKVTSGGTSRDIKLKVTATKLVDEITDFAGFDDSLHKPVKNAPSTYVGTNLRQMVIDGTPEYVRTFYYANTAKAFSDSFAISVNPKNVATNPTLKAIKDVSDSEQNNKSTITVKKKSANDKYTNIVTLNVKPWPKSTKGTAQKQELAIYQIAAADSYDKTTKLYGVGRYMAIALADEKKDEVQGKVSGVMKIGGASANAVLAVGDAPVEIDPGLDAASQAYKDCVNITSKDEGVVVVKTGDGKYRAYGVVQGTTVLEASVAGYVYSTITVNVVDLPSAAAQVVYPGDRDVVIATATPLGGYVTLTYGTLAGNDGGYVTMSDNNVEVSQNAAKLTLSVNKAKGNNADGWSATTVTVPVTATYKVGKLTKSVTKNYSFVVTPYTVDLTDTTPLVMTAKAPATDLAGRIAVTPDKSAGEKSIAAHTGFDDCVTTDKTTISANSLGDGWIEALYTDVNKNEYRSAKTMRFEVEASSGVFTNQTVVSFNAVQAGSASANGVQISSTGLAGGMYSSYERFMTNLETVAKETGEEFTFSITISGNTSKPASVTPDGEEAEEAPEAVETEAPAEEPAAEALEAVAETVAEAVDAADDAAEAVIEALTEAVEPAAEPAAEEAPAEEEPAAGAPEAQEMPEDIADTAGIAKKTYTVKVAGGVVERVGFTDAEIKDFITTNFDNNTTIHMDVEVATSKTVPTLLGIARQVYDKKTATYKRTFKITVEEGTLTFSNVSFDNGVYSVDESGTKYTFRLYGSGNETIMIFDGAYPGDTNPIINQMKKINGLVKGVTVYD